MQADHGFGGLLDLRMIQCGQSWEDTDVLLAALDVQMGDHCLAPAYGGDSALALLSRAPGRVVAIDVNPAQLALVALKAAAFRCLEYDELLGFFRARELDRTARLAYYRRCRPALAAHWAQAWDRYPDRLARGLCAAGRVESRSQLFREWVLPSIHSAEVVDLLLERRSAEDRARFYREVWDTPAWRMLFRLFFSRTVWGVWGVIGPFSAGSRGS